MKLGTFEWQGRRFVGLVTPDERHVFDATAAEAAAGEIGLCCLDTMLGLIDSGEAGLDRLRHLWEREGQEARFVRPLADIKFLPPVPEPRQLREAALFPGHICNAPAGMLRLAAELKGAKPSPREFQPLPFVPAVFRDQPVSYFQNRLNVVGHGTQISWPRASHVMDFELEFGVFLSRGGRDIPSAKAGSHIFGYTLYNDLSARDLQLIESQSGFGPGKSKSFDGANGWDPGSSHPTRSPIPTIWPWLCE